MVMTDMMCMMMIIILWQMGRYSLSSWSRSARMHAYHYDCICFALIYYHLYHGHRIKHRINASLVSNPMLRVSLYANNSIDVTDQHSRGSDISNAFMSSDQSTSMDGSADNPQMQRQSMNITPLEPSMSGMQ